MARQYFVEIGEPQRRHVIARRQSYHGNTLGALAVGGNAWRRAQFEPLLIETHHIDPCYAYRLQREGESDADYAARAAQALEDKILEIGPDRVIAFVAETVVGATFGAVPPVGDYFKRIRAICDRYGVLLILDEVMCGMGRTGTLHACEQEGVAPDLMTVAKGLGGGYQPIGAVLLAKRIYRGLRQRLGRLPARPHLYGPPDGRGGGARGAGGHPARQAAGQRRRDGRKLCSGGSTERFGQHPFVGDIRGRGLFWALELVEDRASKRPFDPALKAPCARQARGDGARPDGLSDGRHDRRRAGRPCPAGAAVHRRGASRSTRSSSASATRSMRRSPCDSRAKVASRHRKSTVARERLPLPSGHAVFRAWVVSGRFGRRPRVERTDLVARGFRLSALGLRPPLGCAGARRVRAATRRLISARPSAQREIVEAGQERAQPRPSPRPKRSRAPTPGSTRRAS